MLTTRYPESTIRQALLSRESWRPYPTVEDRASWSALADDLRRSLLERGESALGFDYPALPATVFLEFARNGNRTNYQDIRSARRGALADLVLAECVEGEGRFLDDIVNGIWCTCEETYWGVPAHLYMQQGGPGLPNIGEPTVDLFAAETSALMAWTYYLLGDRLDAVSPLVRPRILHEVQWRILTPCERRDDFWWMGFSNHPVYDEPRVNNWNPWINSNWLTTALLLEEDSERRIGAVNRILRSLDVFITHYSDDGGCDEGPGYWGRAAASLFDNLEILSSATGGAVDVFDDEKVRNMGRFIYRAQIKDSYFVNFADASALVTPSASLVFRYGKRIGDDGMVALGAWASRSGSAGRRSRGDSLGRALPALFAQEDLDAAAPGQPLPRDVWLPGVQFFGARDRDGSAEGLYVAAKGGHNAESHNHNDVGNFIVYVDGDPVIIDIGVETYTKKTFSLERYEIWTMQSGYHSLPTVNGHDQAPGIERAAKNVEYASTDDSASLSLDIGGAYPEEAGIRSWSRTVTLDRGRSVTVSDTWSLESVSGPLFHSFMTPCDVDCGPGAVRLLSRSFAEGRTSGSAIIRFDPDLLGAATEPAPVEDARLQSAWGTMLNRVLLTARNPSATGSWTFTITRE